MFLLFKNYSLAEVIYPLIRFNKNDRVPTRTVYMIVNVKG